MSIAEKLTTIAENEQKVYDAGYEKGKAEGGGDNWYDTFWDNFQTYGRRTYYGDAFGGTANTNNFWTAEIFRPKYDLIVTGYPNRMFQYMNLEVDFVEYLNSLGIKFDMRNAQQINHMFAGSLFTRLGELDFTNVTRQTWAFQNVFAGMPNLVTVDKIKSDTPISGFTNMFLNCTALRNITFDCIIEKTNISFLQSPLSTDSMKSVITHLQNYAGTENELLYTVTFSNDCWEALEADSAAPDGGTWQDYVISLGWNK